MPAASNNVKSNLTNQEYAERLRAGWYSQVAGLPGTRESDPLRLFDGRGGPTPSVFGGDELQPFDEAVVNRPGLQEHNAGLTAAGRKAIRDGEPADLTKGDVQEVSAQAEELFRLRGHAKRLESHGGRLDGHDAEIHELADALAATETGTAVIW